MTRFKEIRNPSTAATAAEISYIRTSGLNLLHRRKDEKFGFFKIKENIQHPKEK